MFFPCSNPYSTVINVPLFSLASITRIPLDNPLIILFLIGKFIFSGFVPNGNSVIIAPSFFIISSDSTNLLFLFNLFDIMI